MLFFLFVWVVSAFFPMYLGYWSYVQARDIYQYKTVQTMTNGVPPLLAFYRMLRIAIADSLSYSLKVIRAIPLILSSINTINKSDATEFIIDVRDEAVTRAAEVFRVIDWKSHLCLLYIASTIIMNIKDIFKPPNQLPLFVKTAEGNLNFLDKIRVGVMRRTLDWFLPGKCQ